MRALAAVLVLGLLLASPAAAGPFDLIVIDRPVYTLCPGCGIRVFGADFVLIVNTGDRDIPEQDLLEARFSVAVSTGAVEVMPFVNVFRGPVGPVRPGEVVGAVQPLNQIMLDMVKSDETFRNSAPLFVLDVGRVFGYYDGPILVDFTYTMGDHEGRWTMQADIRRSDFQDVTFNAATRFSANPLPTAAATSSWGAIKKLYR